MSRFFTAKSGDALISNVGNELTPNNGDDLTVNRDAGLDWELTRRANVNFEKGLRANFRWLSIISPQGRRCVFLREARKV